VEFAPIARSGLCRVDARGAADDSTQVAWVGRRGCEGRPGRVLEPLEADGPVVVSATVYRHVDATAPPRDGS